MTRGALGKVKTKSRGGFIRWLNTQELIQLLRDCCAVVSCREKHGISDVNFIPQIEKDYEVPMSLQLKIVGIAMQQEHTLEQIWGFPKSYCRATPKTINMFIGFSTKKSIHCKGDPHCRKPPNQICKTHGSCEDPQSWRSCEE